MREVSVGQPLAAKAKGRQARCGVGEESMFKLFRACVKTPLVVGSRSVHVWQAGSAGEQLLAAHSVSASCWRHVGEVTSCWRRGTCYRVAWEQKKDLN